MTAYITILQGIYLTFEEAKNVLNEIFPNQELTEDDICDVVNTTNNEISCCGDGDKYALGIDLLSGEVNKSDGSSLRCPLGSVLTAKQVRDKLENFGVPDWLVSQKTIELIMIYQN